MQYTFSLPYIDIWYCQGTFIIWIYKSCSTSMPFGYTIWNTNIWRTIDNIGGKFKIEKPEPW